MKKPPMSKRVKVCFLYLSIGFFSFLVQCKARKENTQIEDFSEFLENVARESVLGETGFYVWGGSVVKDDDGIYHMFYSRWRKEYGFNAWVTHSEVAHAVSEKAEGPFKFKEVTLPSRDATYWDGLTTHNPTIHKFGKKYYLYYMGTTGDGQVSTHGLNFIHRNNQRIGVAWADTPNGPWHRSDQPVIDVSNNDQAHDALMASNPSVSKMKDGSILMIYKAVAKQKPMPFGGPVTHLAAIAADPQGPFKKQPGRIFHKEGEAFPAEDPYIWYKKGDDKYYAIVKDMNGTFTKEGTSLAFFTSKDGLDWKPAKNSLVTKKEIRWEDGEIEKVGRLERPQVLIEDGQPTMLYCAVQLKDSTFNVHIPLRKTKKKAKKQEVGLDNKTNEDEWVYLFDGTSTEGWRAYNGESLPPGWIVEDGALTFNTELGLEQDYKGGKDIIYGAEEFDNFELYIEWKLPKGGNSGIFYHLKEGHESPPEVAPEYQLIDDLGYAKMHDLTAYNLSLGYTDKPEELKPLQKTGSDYAMHPADPSQKVLNPIGEWNSSKIIFTPKNVEYWLNGKKLLSFVPWDEAWEEKKNSDKWKNSANYGKYKTGYIGLQDHSSPIWFRNIKIKKL